MLLFKKKANFMSKLLQNYKYLKCQIFRILLKRVSDHLSTFFQYAWLYLQDKVSHLPYKSSQNFQKNVYSKTNDSGCFQLTGGDMKGVEGNHADLHYKNNTN